MPVTDDQKRERRLLTYAVEQVYDGPLLEAVLDYLGSLYDGGAKSAQPAADQAAIDELQERLAKADAQHRREMAECIEKRRRKQARSYARQKSLATGQMLAADGKPIYMGQCLYGDDGQEWMIVGVSDRPKYNVLGMRMGGKGRSGETCRPLRREWLAHQPPAKAQHND